MIWLIVAVSIIVIVYALLTYIIRRAINNALRKKNIIGHVSRVSVNLPAGKITLHNIAAGNNDDSPKSKIAIQIPETIIQFRWKSLFKKNFIGEIRIREPELLVAATAPTPTTETVSTEEAFNLKKLLGRLKPFHVNVIVEDGKIRYGNLYSKPNINLAIESVQLSVYDFTNIPAQIATCKIEADASLYGGRAKINATLFPLEPSLTIDVTTELKALNMVLLNDFLRAYANVDVNRGTLDLYSEIAIRGDSFKGYLKPILKGLDFVGTEDRGDNIFRKVWERIVAISIQALENNRQDQIATKIPIEGRLNDPHVNVGAAIAGILKNAFIRAVTPSLDNISIESLWKNAASRAKGILHKFRSR